MNASKLLLLILPNYLRVLVSFNNPFISILVCCNENSSYTTNACLETTVKVITATKAIAILLNIVKVIAGGNKKEDNNDNNKGGKKATNNRNSNFLLSPKKDTSVAKNKDRIEDVLEPWFVDQYYPKLI